MYLCETCDATFFRPKLFVERHGLNIPPFEELACCPNCNSLAIRQKERRKRYAK